MKHAGGAALEQLADLLAEIRARDAITEKRYGVFYRKSKPFLHFHEDPMGLFADLRAGPEFYRYPVNTKTEWNTLLSAIDRVVG